MQVDLQQSFNSTSILFLKVVLDPVQTFLIPFVESRILVNRLFHLDFELFDLFLDLLDLVFLAHLLIDGRVNRIQ